VLWDVGLMSSVVVITRARLVSSAFAFMGSGLSTHAAFSFFSWGPDAEPRRLGVYGGGSLQILAEIIPRGDLAMMDVMKPPKTYGLYQAEGGIEVDTGALHFAATPFPLSPSGRALPRWFIRVGYQHSWLGGLNSGGYVTALRFTW
jgi:hypothetical protein